MIWVVLESLTQQSLKAGFKIYMYHWGPKNDQNSSEKEEANLIIMSYEIRNGDWCKNYETKRPMEHNKLDIYQILMEKWNGQQMHWNCWKNGIVSVLHSEHKYPFHIEWKCNCGRQSQIKLLGESMRKCLWLGVGKYYLDKI